MSRYIPRSRIVAGLAFAVALGAHAAALVRTEPKEELLQEGGGGAAVAALGSAFADLAVGTASPVEADELPTEEPVEPSEPDTATEADTPDIEETQPVEVTETPTEDVAETESPAPEPPAEVTPETTVEVQPPLTSTPPAEVTPEVQTDLSASIPQEPVETPPVTVQATAPTTGTAVLPMPTTPEPAVTTPVVQVQPVEPNATDQTLTEAAPVVMAALPPQPSIAPVNEDTDSAAPLISRRPPSKVPDRPERTEPVAPPKATAKAEPKKKPAAAPRGNNSERTATKGTTSGTTTGKAAQAATSNAKSTKAGNAAMSNYRGKVFRKIARARRGSVNIAGKTLVSLTIAPSGQLAGVSVARSSGSGKLDQIAVAQVRRAAPFPTPPNGKSLTFTLQIKGNK